jgi:DNA-binding LytR/AlgR family response regulator
MSMKILIIEDEPHNARMLADMMNKLRPGWEIEAILESVRQSVSWLKSHPQPGLILMDIQLSDGICFSIFEQVKVSSQIIFTTAYDNFAIRAFKVNSIDYLLKPIKDSELEAALRKLEGQRHEDAPGLPAQGFAEMLQAIREGRKEYRKRFMITSGNRYYKLNTYDIACFVSENKVTTAITFDNEMHVVDFSLDRLEEELDPDLYFRADRKTIIHIDLVSRFEDYFGSKLIVRLKQPINDKITISRLRASAFKIWVGK